MPENRIKKYDELEIKPEIKKDPTAIPKLPAPIHLQNSALEDYFLHILGKKIHSKITVITTIENGIATTLILREEWVE